MCTVTKESGNGEEASATASSAENVNTEQVDHKPSLLIESINEEVHVEEGADSKYRLTVVSVDGRVVSDVGETDKSDSSSPGRISDSDVDVVASKHGIIDIHGPADSENPIVHEALEVSGKPSNECEPEEEEKQSCSKDCTQAAVSTGSPEAARVSDKGVLGFDLNVQPVFSSISISSKDASDGEEIDSCEVSSNYSSKRKISGVGLDLDLNESPYLADDDDDASYHPTIFGSSLFDNMNYDMESKRNGPSSSQWSILTNGQSGISSDACFQLPNFGSSLSDNMSYGVESNRNAPSSSQPPILTNGQSGNSFMGPSTSSPNYYPFMVDSTFPERLNSTQFNMNEVASSNAGFNLISGSTTMEGLFHDEDSNEYTRLSLGLPGKRKEPEGGLELSLCTFKQQQLSL